MGIRGGGGAVVQYLSGQTFSTTILLLCHFGQFCRRVSGKLTVQLAGGPRVQAAPATAATPPPPTSRPPFTTPLASCMATATTEALAALTLAQTGPRVSGDNGHYYEIQIQI